MENTPKQTAVEWLYAKLEALRGELNYDLIDYEMYKIEKTRIYREALHREKQQDKFTNSPIHDKKAIIEMMNKLHPKEMAEVVEFIKSKINL